MKLPVLRTRESALFGAQNICRALAQRSSQDVRIIWPEDVDAALARNAQELTWHGMAAQVQIAFGLLICNLPPDRIDRAIPGARRLRSRIRRKVLCPQYALSLRFLTVIMWLIADVPAFPEADTDN